MELLIEYFAKGLMTMLMIAMPCVLTAAAIGLVVGILQAVTQVQEQTIAAAPKIFSVFLVIIILGTGYLKLLSNLFQEGSVLAFEVVPKSEEFVLPSDYYNYTKPFIDEMKTDVKKDMTPLSSILNNAAKPQGTAQSEKFNFLRNGAKDIPEPNLVERKKITENKK
ncbi:MAG: flagellar biosynthetic protein FliQ [Candidatus Gastranaerophilales bacterium]|nr:flagellar biosynthetic protein FliQ [Candidatus Gastranaerophilales bacterium]